MKIALTGASGFLGTCFNEYVSARAWEVLPLGRCETVQSLTEKLDAFKPDCVVHLATCFVGEHSAEDIDRLVDGNILFGLKVLQAMQSGGCKQLVNAGSDWQNWNGERGVPASLYAALKNAFEECVKFFVSSGGLQVVNLRFCDTYGKDDPRGKLVAKLVAAVKSGARLELSPGEQLLNLTHKSDVAEALRLAVLNLKQQQPGGFIKSFRVASGEQRPLKDVVALVEKLAGAKLNGGVGKRAYRQREVMKPSLLDPALPGWSPKVSLHEGLKELLDA